MLTRPVEVPPGVHWRVQGGANLYDLTRLTGKRGERLLRRIREAG